MWKSVNDRSLSPYCASHFHNSHIILAAFLLCCSAAGGDGLETDWSYRVTGWLPWLPSNQKPSISW